MGNNQPNQISLKSLPDENKNIAFGGTIEEEMIQKFFAFDIIWYAPKDSEKLENWIAFTNVKVTKISDMNIFIQQAVKSRLFNNIIITTGSFAEKTIPLVEPNLLIPNIIIYCMNIDYHKKWSENYKSIIQVFSHPAQIFEYLLKIQEASFYIPLFSYNFISKKEFNFNYYLWFINKEIKCNQDNFSLKLNDYEKFCVKALHDYRLAYIENEVFLKVFIKNTPKILTLFYQPNFLDLIETMKQVKELNLFLIRLTLISLYFSKYPFLFGLLEYPEIETILKENIEPSNLRIEFKELHSHLEILENKLEEEKVSILNETTHLKFLHIFLIKCCKYFTKIIYGFEDYSKFPFMIKSLNDLDFCLKYFFFRIYGFYDDPIYKMRFRGAINKLDKRKPIFYTYSSIKHYENEALKYISKEQLQIMNKTLLIKDFFVIGNKKFQDKIKTIENYYIHRKIFYLTMEQMRNSVENEVENYGKYRNFSYIFIMKAEEAELNFKEIYSIINEFALNIMLIIYIEDKNTLINKNVLMDLRNIPVFLANNIEEIKDFIISQENCNCGRCFLNLSSKMVNILKGIETIGKYFPKTCDSINIEDGWELADLIPKEFFNIKNLSINGFSDTDSIAFNFFELYKENGIEELFFDKYCQYLSFSLLTEIIVSKNLNIIIKQFLYAYTLDEDKNSLFYILNKTLRSGDVSKMQKYFCLIYALNMLLKAKIIKYFNGEVLRATHLEKDFIEEKIIVGNVLTNLSFWSATKSEKIAKNFLKDAKRNILFIINSKGENIDIDSEKISSFNEEEVLFLPYSKYEVKSKEKKIFNNKEIYEVKLEQMDKQDERGNIKPLNIASEEIYRIFDFIK